LWGEGTERETHDALRYIVNARLVGRTRSFLRAGGRSGVRVWNDEEGGVYTDRQLREASAYAVGTVTSGPVVGERNRETLNRS
jgi:hypothetical protein